MTKHFDGATIVITGGASGIGNSLAHQLKSLGARIIIIDRNSVDGFEAMYQGVDMSDAVQAKNTFDDILNRYEKIDYVFNSAGIFMAGEIRDTPIENWQKVVNNNIWAVYNGAHFAYQAMLGLGSGHIINFASAAGLFPVPIMGIYGSSKFAIVGLSHELRNEAKSLGINVSVVCPTIVNTPLYDTAIYNRLDKPKALKGRGSLQTPEVAAEKIIKGVLKNKATIHTAFSTRAGWLAYRFVPGVYNYFAQNVIKKYRNTLRLDGNS